MQRLVLPSDMEAEEPEGLHLRADGRLVESTSSACFASSTVRHIAWSSVP
jgi:hypothetical protein